MDCVPWVFGHLPSSRSVVRVYSMATICNARTAQCLSGMHLSVQAAAAIYQAACTLKRAKGNHTLIRLRHTERSSSMHSHFTDVYTYLLAESWQMAVLRCTREGVYWCRYT